MTFFTGFMIGVASLIPGISSGTILVLTNEYERITNTITHFRKKENRITLLILLLGIIMGTLTFARIIEFFFYFFPISTMLFFASLVLFNLPSFIKKEKIKISPIFLFLGISVLTLLSFFHINADVVITEYPKITFLFLIFFGLSGTIDGFFTILPGISGSMVVMILGPYFLYKSFLANLDFTHFYFIFPLFFYFLGDAIGFFLGSKVSLYFLKKHRQKFMSFIVGMIIMSIIIIIPHPNSYSNSLFSFLLPLVSSFIICSLLNKSS